MQFRVFKVENAKDYVITATILVLAIAISISRNNDGLKVIRQASITIVSFLEEPLSNIRVYRQALKNNKYLQQQNILLQDELSKLRSIEKENYELRKLLNYKNESEFTLIPVRIITKKINGINNTFTIDAGILEGIKIGMPLVTSDGLIGKIILTSESYSQVMPYYNSLFRVSARIQETRSTGIVSWEGKNQTELVMEFVPKTISIDSGFVIETSGFGNDLPGGIPIGSVTKTLEEKGKDTQRIYLSPFNSLSEISEGFVITFIPDSSLSHLTNKANQLFNE